LCAGLWRATARINVVELVPRLTAWGAPPMIEFTGCTHCKSIRFLAGPRGGSSQNIVCLGCGARLNVMIPPLPGPFMLMHELSGPTKPPQPPYYGVAYIIELVP
jgi:hypothetical protein